MSLMIQEHGKGVLGVPQMRVEAWGMTRWSLRVPSPITRSTKESGRRRWAPGPAIVSTHGTSVHRRDYARTSLSWP